MILGMFINEESSDIVFAVGVHQFDSDEMKKAKTSSTKFPAHRLLLQEYSSPTLAQLCIIGG